ncbi:MAG: response regulator [Brevinematales bacterium]|nr:response regulator [Brevinematales bacterium]
MQKKKYNFLIVEDEISVLKVLNDILKLSPVVNMLYSAENGEDAFEIYKTNEIDVVVTDIMMPKITGLELIKKIKDYNPEAHIIVISAYGSVENLKEAIRNGAYDYILKPFTVDEILFAINRVVDKLRLLYEKKKYIISLEKAVKEAKKELESSFYDSLKAILNTLEVRDVKTLEHSHNVAIYAEKLGKKAGFSKKELDSLIMGATLHDIGKIGIPDNILLKNGKLEEMEYEIIKRHPLIGRKILLPMLANNSHVLEIVSYHHERFDGDGYPEGLKGLKIPLFARVVSIANAYDRMLNGTLYSSPKDFESIKKDFIFNSGKQFDPELVRIFLSIIEG